MSERSTAEVRSMIGGMWQELLDVDDVGPQTRLLEAGGNSLIATMLANRIELTWGFRPSMEMLLTCTFDELCKVCSA
ncbi:acyl carrier protein [Micromonospora sp. CA-249363]|uniref:acyl carrier protein n=1 Tax=Micromonospora sp. CA-249363 TaxID=3239963 RepID=UPI003D8DE0E7